MFPGTLTLPGTLPGTIRLMLLVPRFRTTLTGNMLPSHLLMALLLPVVLGNTLTGNTLPSPLLMALHRSLLRTTAELGDIEWPAPVETVLGNDFLFGFWFSPATTSPPAGLPSCLCQHHLFGCCLLRQHLLPC